MRTLYDSSFYENRDISTRASAEKITEVLCSILSVSSVCDVGCGVGTWLSVFKIRGAEEICGLDGEWVEKAKLVIPFKNFIQTDLSNPPNLGRTFDLAMSLEVAEHIPEAKAGQFIRFLTSLAPVVMFSGAIPGQGGIGHVNEQWPSYWTPLFNSNGFVLLDCIRPRIWDSPELLMWYRQNILLYARPDKAAEIQKRCVDRHLSCGRQQRIESSPSMTNIVHPEMFSIILGANRALTAKTEHQGERLRLLRAELERLKSEQRSIRSNVSHLTRNLLTKLRLKGDRATR